jgi:hypothetical protein
LVVWLFFFDTPSLSARRHSTNRIFNYGRDNPRLAAYEKDPDAGSSWEEVEARIRARLKVQ